MRLSVFVLIGVICLQGCAPSPVNPSFPLSVKEARLDLRRMEQEPIALTRPLVVIGGYYDPGIAAHRVAQQFRRITTTPEQVIQISFWSNGSFETCRQRVLDEVQDAFPSEDPNSTTEVDVVAISMGGLIARDAAIPRDGQRALHMDRLFAVATPHCGADLATLPTFDERQVGMRRGSEFLASLDRALETSEYELVCYVRLGDTIVGAENTAPMGQAAWWLPNKPFEFAHLEAHHDERILADIARRLRGETPWTIEPPEPLPNETKAESTPSSTIN